MIDLHCHILPGLDDGPEDMEETLAMARIAVREGIHTVVGTPHTLNEAFVIPMARIREVTAEVREALTRKKIPLNLLPGAEVRFCPEILRHVKEGNAGTLNDNGRYILLEFPALSTPPGLKEEIFSLTRNGVFPVIAHPERNPEIQRNLGILTDLAAMGALFQVTAMSLTGEFGPSTKRCAEEMVRRRLAHVIASDAHWARDRVPALVEAAEHAAEILQDFEAAKRMVEETPARILAGDPVEVSESTPRKKRNWFW
jgi:protein-tyrosine phosphatase